MRRFQPPNAPNIEIPFSGPVVAYIKSLVQPFSGAGSSGGGSGGGAPFPILASNFTPAAAGSTAVATITSSLAASVLKIGEEIQIPYTTVGTPPYVGLITAISGTSITIETPTTATVVNSLNGETGALTLAAGTGLTLTTSGTTITAALVVPVTAADGGTGLTSPGTSGNVLTSTGSAWASSAPSSGGVTSITDSSSATGAITFTGSGVSQSGTTFTFSSGGGGGTTATLNTAQQAISSIIHQWRCNDAAGSSTLADSVGSSTLTVGSDASAGVTGLLNDGATGVYLSGAGSANSYLQKANVLPVSGAMCVEMLVSFYHSEGNGSNVGIIACLGYGSSALSGADFNVRTGTGGYQYEWTILQSDTAFYGGFPTFTPVLLHIELDGAGGCYGSINGALIYSSTTGFPSTLATPTLLVGTYGYSGGPVYSPTMVVQNIAVYNARLTAAQKMANMTAIFRR